MFLLSIVTILGGLLVFCLDTPQHDELKLIEKKLKEHGSGRNAEQVANELRSNAKYKNLSVLSFAFFAMFCNAVQSGMLTFITEYSKSYLKVSAGTGRYLISTYNFALLIYRVLTMATCGCSNVHSFLHSLGFMKIHLVVMSIGKIAN